MKLLLYPKLEALFDFIIPRLEKLRERVAICQQCGRNRYTGAPCVTYKEVR